MIIYNPTKEEQKFYYGHIPYVFRPKESRNLEEEVALFALKRGNRNLVEYTPHFDSEMEFTDVEYSKLPWGQLRNIASAKGIYKPGLKRPEVENLLMEYDNKQTGINPSVTS